MKDEPSMKKSVQKVNKLMWVNFSPLLDYIDYQKIPNISKVKLDEMLRQLNRSIARMRIYQICNYIDFLNPSFQQIKDAIYGQRLVDYGIHYLNDKGKIVNKTQFRISSKQFRQLNHGSYIFLKLRITQYLSVSIFLQTYQQNNKYTTSMNDQGDNGKSDRFFKALNRLKTPEIYETITPQEHQTPKEFQQFNITFKEKSRLRLLLWNSLRRIYDEIKPLVKQSAKNFQQTPQINRQSQQTQHLILQKISYLFPNCSKINRLILLDSILKNYYNFQAFATQSIRNLGLINLNHYQSIKTYIDTHGLDIREFKDVFYQSYEFLLKSKLNDQFLKGYFQLIDLDRDWRISTAEYKAWIEEFISVVNYRDDTYWKYTIYQDDRNEVYETTTIGN